MVSESFPRMVNELCMQVPVIDSGGVFEDWTNLRKVNTVTTDITSMNADTLNYWLSKFVMEVANSEGGDIHPEQLITIIITIIIMIIIIIIIIIRASANHPYLQPGG